MSHNRTVPSHPEEARRKPSGRYANRWMMAPYARGEDGWLALARRTSQGRTCRVEVAADANDRPSGLKSNVRAQWRCGRGGRAKILAAGGQIPDLDGPVGPTRPHIAPRGGKGDPSNEADMAAETKASLRWSRCSRFVRSGAVIAGGRDRAAVRAEGDAVDPVFRGLSERPWTAAVCRVPEADRPSSLLVRQSERRRG